MNNSFEIAELISAYDFSFSHGYAFRGESHDFWEAFYVASGSLEVTCDDSIYSMGAGDMLFYPPLSFHKINSVGKNGVRLFNIAFKTEGELPCGIPMRVFPLSSTEGDEFSHTFDIMKGCIKGDGGHPYAAQLAVHRLSTLIIELALDHSVEDRSLTSVSASEYRRLVSCMKEQVCDNLSLTELALKNHVSVSYVKLLFNKYAGISPKAYYAQLRLNTAKNMLKSRVPVSEVSSRMNFSSHNYFARYFKRSTGMTPTEYKKQWE